jgi:hypothetical protein
MADMAEEVNIGYSASPIAVGSPLKHANVVAGDHLPHVVDEAVQKQLGAVCGTQNTGHTVVTVADRHVAPAAGDGQLQVLVTVCETEPATPVAGYDSVIADPKGVVAQRLGLTNGGRVVIRPDGYIGAMAALDDTTTIADYFATLRS